MPDHSTMLDSSSLSSGSPKFVEPIQRDGTKSRCEDSWIRTKASLYDRLRFDARVSRALSVCVAVYSSLTATKVDQSGRTLERLCKAARLAPHGYASSQFQKQLPRLRESIKAHGVRWDQVAENTSPSVVSKAIILKPPIGPREKGVLLVSFEEQWLRILRHADLEALARDYHLVMAPSWSPPQDPALVMASWLWPGTAFHLVSNHADLDIVPRFAPGLIGVPLLASNWVHPQLFSDAATPAKNYDIVMLANFAKYKRHTRLFAMLRRMDPEVTVLLLGKPMQGRSEHTIMREARAFGVERQITIRVGLGDSEMIQMLRAAKVSLICSGVEGSCVAIAESILAGIPVAVYDEARIGSKAFINQHTGVLLKPRSAPQQLGELIESHASYNPRKWAEENRIDCFGSTDVLNRTLRTCLTDRGEVWTRDIVPHHWRPNPTYVYPADAAALANARHSFPRYGISLT